MKPAWICRRFSIACLVCALTVASAAPVSAQTNAARYFPETGHFVSGAFLEKFLAVGSPLMLYGYPITEQFTNREGLLVQYFQRARFEFRPDLPPEEQTQLTDIGAALYAPAVQLNVADPQNCRFFENGLSVCFAFLKFFEENGGAAQFGKPISPFEYHDSTLVQYFEKARFEWKPSMPEGQQVALTDLGRIYFDRAGEDPALLAPLPPFGNTPAPTPVSFIDQIVSYFLTAIPSSFSSTSTPQATLAFEPTQTPTEFIFSTETTLPTDPPPVEAATDIFQTATFFYDPAPTPSPFETATFSYQDTLTPENSPTAFAEDSTATVTDEPAATPTIEPTLTPTLTPTPSILRAAVLELSNCRYGPGQPYLYKYGLLKGNRLEVIGRIESGSWVFVRAIGGNNPCWVKASLLSIQGDVMSVDVVYPGKYTLPKSPYYPPLTGAKATRNGDQVRLTWTAMALRPGDEESPTSPLYLVETWTCQGGQIVFTPIGAYDNVAYIKDEAGCSTPSYGRVFFSEKHGYAGPTDFAWP